MTAKRTKNCIESLYSATFSFRSALETIERLREELDWDDDNQGSSGTSVEERKLVRENIDTLLGHVATGTSLQIEEFRQELIRQSEILEISVDNRGKL